MTESAATVESSDAPEIGERSWRISVATILIVGAILRLYHLSLVPFHHDEGVNGEFLLKLVHYNFYQYDPQNYHGPTLYYFAAIIPWLSRLLFGVSFEDSYGLSDFTLRFTTAAFGVLTIWLVLTLRRRLGTIATLGGAALLAVSPGAVYLSRYFIHEALFVFFTLATIVAALKFYESGRTAYLLLTAASVALLFATKETAIITAGVLLIAITLTALIVKLRAAVERNHNSPPREEVDRQAGSVRPITERFGGPSSLFIIAISAISVFLMIELLFYSSFFSNYPQGIYDALKTFRIWTQTSKAAQIHPWWRYLSWMFKEESPLLLLGVAGFGLALWRGTNRLAIFTALWALGMLAAYSLIPYKTPWLMLNFVVPLAITSGYALEEIYQRTKQITIALVIGLAALGLSGSQMLMLNFVHYDESAYVYPYVHTYRGISSMLDEIDRIAQRLGTDDQTEIEFGTPDYWPLPWYLRKYSHVKFPGKVGDFTEPMVIVSTKEADEFMAKYANRYQLTPSIFRAGGTYKLRPGVDLLLFVRRDLAER